MGGGKAIRDADHHADDLPPGARLGARPVHQRPVIDEFHDEVLPAVEFADIVDGQDVWVIQ